MLQQYVTGCVKVEPSKSVLQQYVTGCVKVEPSVSGM